MNWSIWSHSCYNTCITMIMFLDLKLKSTVELWWLEVAGTILISIKYRKSSNLLELRVIKAYQIVPAAIICAYITKTFKFWYMNTLFYKHKLETTELCSTVTCFALFVTKLVKNLVFLCCRQSKKNNYNFVFIMIFSACIWDYGPLFI